MPAPVSLTVNCNHTVPAGSAWRRGLATCRQRSNTWLAWVNLMALLSLTLALCSPGKCLLPDMQLVARNFEQDGVARGVVKTSFGP